NRMAIEEADLRDRKIWSGVARMWYNKAANKSPNVGRIQHHLAVFARPNIVQQQLFYYLNASLMEQFCAALDNHICRVRAKFRGQKAEIARSLCTATFSFGIVEIFPNRAQDCLPPAFSGTHIIDEDERYLGHPSH